MLSILTIITSPSFKWLAIIAAVVALLIGTYHTGYSSGVNANKVVVQKQEQKQESIVIDKNTTIQGYADASPIAIIVYKDRIETKYKTITNTVNTYEKTSAANTILDADFVRLHDAAASPISNSDTPTGVTNGTINNTTIPTATVTTGKAIEVIQNNYKDYDLCRSQVIELNSFYNKVKDEVNK